MALNPDQFERLPSPSRGAAPGSGRLEDRRILVVGGGSQPCDDPDAPAGNGRAIAVIAAREGADVVIVDRDKHAAEVTAALVEAEHRRAHVVLADVSDPADCEAMIGRSVDAVGELHGIVVNVGIGVGFGLRGTSLADWDRAIAVNLRAHFLVAKAAVDVLHEGGSLVFMGSAAGIKPGTGSPSYDTTKAGLAGLMRHTAVELAPNRRANLVVPGIIDTPLGRSIPGGRPKAVENRPLLRREGTAWEVANATIWLLSDESAYVTAQSLIVDGGLTVR